MLISIQIKNGSTLRADICGENCVCLCYDNSYMPGDVISFQCTEPGYYWVCLEDALAPVLAYFSGTPFEFLIPFGEKRSCYSQKCFIGNRHLLWVRIANPEEITAYRNLAFNPLDHHNNTSLFQRFRIRGHPHRFHLQAPLLPPNVCCDFPVFLRHCLNHKAPFPPY